MNTTNHEHAPPSPRASGMNASLKVALLMVAVIVGFLLLREHWDHVAGKWVYLLLLVCPLMHLFHGHGGHGAHGKPDDKPASRE
ncbi:DUF2933 domain-containing protein [Ramlibacter lithotrophicus]